MLALAVSMGAAVLVIVCEVIYRRRDRRDRNDTGTHFSISWIAGQGTAAKWRPRAAARSNV